MEPFITFRPIGRTGNLMFQCAAAIGYAKKYNVKWGVPSDTREVPHFHKMFPGLPRADGSYRTYNEHPHGICPTHNVSWDDCHFNYHAIPQQSSPTKLLGFYQSYKYFEGADEEIKKVFKLEHVPGYEDYVSIHVRRGDYVMHSGSFPPVDKNYILTAMSKFSYGLKAIVFSDDIDWCKATFPEYSHFFEYSEGRNELQDLSLMASCGHHIIANSTFSWWSAYLGHNPDRIVISPSCVRGNWFGMDCGVKQDVVDLLPENWIQIKFR